jgi:hypothetical protein
MTTANKHYDRCGAKVIRLPEHAAEIETFSFRHGNIKKYEIHGHIRRCLQSGKSGPGTDNIKAKAFQVRS